MSGNQRNRRDKVWVSHNRVLVGGNKKNVRNPNFDTEETKLLITLWGNPAIQKTLITSHKKFPIITKLSEAMRQYGYQRTPEEINTRLKNLKCLYNRLKKDVECGIRSQPTWKHFSAMDAILTRPIFGYQNSGELLDEDEDSGQVLIKDELGIDLDDDDELRPEDLLQLEETPETQFQPAAENDVAVKEEPIDVDEYEDKKSATKEHLNCAVTIEKLPKLIPRSSWLNNGQSSNNTNTAREQNPPPPLTSSHPKVTRQNSVICVSAPRSLAAVTSTTSTISNVPQGGQLSPQSKGKISLVPTNLLLNQQQKQQQQQKNFIVSKSVPTITPTSQATVAAASTLAGSTAEKPKMPMKVLLVNTMPNHAQMPTTPTTPSSHCTNNSKAEIIPLPMEQAPPKPQPTIHYQTTMPSSLPPTFLPSSFRKTPAAKVHKKTPVNGQSIPLSGIKSLLSNLIRTQQEANVLSRERLQLDREKFNYERRVVDQMLGLVPILKDIGVQFLQQQQSSPVQEPEQAGPSVQMQPSSSSVQCNGHEPAIVDEEVVVATTEDVDLDEGEGDEEEEEGEVSDT